LDKSKVRLILVLTIGLPIAGLVVYGYILNLRTSLFTSGNTSISFDNIAYGLGDTIKLKITVKVGINVMIESVTLKSSSAQGWNNQVLFYEGKRSVPGMLTYVPGQVDSTYEYLNISLPYTAPLGDIVRAEIYVLYVYASGGSPSFYEVRKSDVVTIEIKTKK
jgi:hypothetical protein